MHAAGHALLLHAEGRHAEALDRRQVALEAREDLRRRGASRSGRASPIACQPTWRSTTTKGAAPARRRGRPAARRRCRTSSARTSARFRARLAVRAGDARPRRSGFKRAGALFREISTPFPLAVTLLEHAECLVGRAVPTTQLSCSRRPAQIFERLGATPWLERARQRRRRREVDRMTCASCGTDNDAGQKFCGECGAPLAAVCAVVRRGQRARQKFCGECGAALAAHSASPSRGGFAAAGGTAARERPVRRPRRLHDGVGEHATPRTHASCSRATSTPRAR